MSPREFYPRRGATPYEAARADLGKRNCRWLPGKVTALVYLPCQDVYVINYRGTAVVTYHRDGSIEVHHGYVRGHKGGDGSVTTKRRIQTYAPGLHRVFQIRKKWLVAVADYEQAQPFVCGMRLYPDGTLVYPNEEHAVAVARRVAPPPPPPPPPPPRSGVRVRKRPRQEHQLALAV